MSTTDRFLLVAAAFLLVLETAAALRTLYPMRGDEWPEVLW